MSQRLSGYMEVGGETLVVLFAALWIMHLDFVPYGFAAGSVLFALGRLSQGEDKILAETRQEKLLNMRRLLRQRNIGTIILLLSAALMFVRHTQHLTQEVYLFPSTWLVPFVCFVVIEVYTAFRIPHLLK